MKRVLIVIDMQEDFVRGSLGSKDAEAIVSKVKTKITEYMVSVDIQSMIVNSKELQTRNYENRKSEKNLRKHHFYQRKNRKIMNISFQKNTHMIMVILMTGKSFSMTGKMNTKSMEMFARNMCG